MKFALPHLLVFFLLTCNPPPLDKTITEETQSAQQTTDLTTFIGRGFYIDPQHSYLGFKIKYFGFSPVRGRFDAFDGNLFYDPENINSLSVTVYAEAASINTGNATRDEDLTKEGSWFDAANHPTLTFKSETVLPKAGGGFDLVGPLTIKGNTLIDTVSFEPPTALSRDWAANEQVDFSGSFTINRQDYGVFGGDFWSSVMENGLTQLSDEVEIEVDMHCRRADYNARFETADSLDVDRLVLVTFRTQGTSQGIAHLNEFHEQGNLTAGKLSSIGYTLNTWEKHEAALSVFQKRLEWFPELSSTHNQLGITYLYLNDLPNAKSHFQQVLEKNPTDSRGFEYYRLINNMETSE